MIIGKFSKDFAKGNKTAQNIIESIVNSFFQTEKVTEESLRNLKAQVADATRNVRPPTGKYNVIQRKDQLRVMLDLKHKVKREINNKFIIPNHHKNLKTIKKVEHHKQVKNQEQHHPMQAQWLLNLYTTLKDKKMMSGQHWLNSILSYSKKKKNFKELDNKSLKRKLRFNQIIKSNKRRKDKEKKNNNKLLTTLFKLNKLKSMIKDNLKNKLN